MPQSHRPGAEAEADFGEIVVRLAGEQVKFFLFCFRLSFSGKAARRVSLSGGQALCSVMSMLAAMSRSRAPGS